MSTAPARPNFFEGQIAAAVDFNGIVKSSRTALAQHSRYLHTEGIAQGLKLAVEKQKTAAGDDFVAVTLGSGLAVDGTGRHLVLPEDERLSEELFVQLNVINVSEPDAYYPVFITGRDQKADNRDGAGSTCETAGTKRINEQVDITFGRVEEAADPQNKEVDAVDEGPRTGTSSAPWRVLVGFVQWDASIKRFKAIAETADGITPSYAGVRADDVISHSDQVVLRSAPKGENGTAALAVRNAAGGALEFGQQNSQGEVVPVFTVNGNGDVHAEGKITGAIAGGVQVQGGVAFDGATLPLPPGISAQQVDDGEVVIHAHVTAHFGIPALPSPGAGDYWLMRVIECRLDARRVYCRVRWESTNGLGGSPIELPGACDYTLMAFTAA
ncbi:MAG: hypothetical protein KZQ88_07375 [Candidatus Thiodiazotropha sp. (ex Dulcina madagascariensis)]|nr:hypothetical protein [Candidatus Thiodiazotropha sp. (ex Dulcina madagascariensis)]MCU7925870.1 hypothetical protein [Candidatus Thiodiazotropha sp. (ex Dulcina madagascariensis)]